MKKILFVEDNDAYREQVASILRDNGFEVDTAENAIVGMEVFQPNVYDIVIADLKMEIVDGLRFMAFVKKNEPSVKTIILTGEISSESESAAIDLNVDRYLRKDIHVDVLIKYINLVLKETDINTPFEEVLESKAEKIKVYPARRQVFKEGKEVEITTTEFELLSLLLRKKGMALNREEIINEIWDEAQEINELRIVDAHMKSLRKKLGIISVATIRGFGYKWNEY